MRTLYLIWMVSSLILSMYVSAVGRIIMEKYKLKDAKGMFHACIGTTIEKTKETMFRFEGPDFRMRSLEKTHLIAFTKLKRQRGFL